MPQSSSVSAVGDEGDYTPSAHRSLAGLCSPVAPTQAAIASHSRDYYPLTPIRLATEAARVKCQGVTKTLHCDLHRNVAVAAMADAHATTTDILWF